jgi:hypothetical protein
MSRGESASEVIARGAAAVAAAQPDPGPRGSAPIEIPIVVRQTLTGCSELVDARTGQSWGIGATAEIAAATQRFFRHE